jgi:hypothetical protein
MPTISVSVIRRRSPNVTAPRSSAASELASTTPVWMSGLAGTARLMSPRMAAATNSPAAHDPIAGSWWGNRILVPPFTVSL